MHFPHSKTWFVDHYFLHEKLNSAICSKSDGSFKEDNVNMEYGKLCMLLTGNSLASFITMFSRYSGKLLNCWLVGWKK
jgi:hypothetical protein